MSILEEDDSNDEPDPIQILSVLETTSRKNLVADIVGHPKGMPSGKELRYLNPSLSAATISEHLQRLEDAGVIHSLSVDRDGHPADAPKAFYYLTENARRVFDDNNLFGEAEHGAVYEQVEKTDEIKEAEQFPRPDVESETVALE